MEIQWKLARAIGSVDKTSGQGGLMQVVGLQADLGIKPAPTQNRDYSLLGIPITNRIL